MMRRVRGDRSDDLHLTGPERAFATYEGTTGADVYAGTSGNDTITGNGGDDRLAGGDGDDMIDGGDGADVIEGGAGNNVLRGGTGYNDRIISSGGADTVIGGGYSDSWFGYYSRSTDNLSFDLAAGTLSNGTTLTGIESCYLYTGYGDDTFDLAYGHSFYIDAGGSHDAADIDYSALQGVGRRGSGLSAIFTAAGDTFAVSLKNEATRASNGIGNVEDVHLIGSHYGDVFAIRGKVDAGLLGLSIDGGDGVDRLDLDLHTVASTRFVVDAGGSISSTFGSFASIETVHLTLGEGTNVATLGSGDDIIAAAGSGDQLAGGAGDDTISESGTNAAIDGGDGTDTWLIAGLDGLRFDQATLTDSLGTRVTGIETVAIDLTGDATGGVYTLEGEGTAVTVNVDNSANAIVFDLSGRSEAVTFAAGANPGVGRYDYAVGNAHVLVSKYLGGAAIAIVGTGFDDTFRFEDNSQINITALDGGAGIDTLDVDLNGIRQPVMLIVANDGTIQSSIGALARLERFDLTLYGGGHVVTTGKYDDVITVTSYGDASDRDNALAGGGGDDTITGASATDRLSGGNGDDLLIGGAGNDRLDGGNGNDILDGGTGIDTVSYARAAGAIDIALVSGAQNTHGAGRDLLSSIENLAGSRYDDLLTGNAGTNRLSGAAGDDRLSGGDGADLLIGGAGADRLAGGAGADRFGFTTLADFAGTNLDRILDFSHAEGDRVDLSRIDPDAASGDQGFTFVGSASFTAGGSASELRTEDRGNGTFLVQGDVDHDGHADFSLIVAADQPLTAADFLL